MSSYEKNQKRGTADIKDMLEKLTRFFYKKVCSSLFEVDQPTFGFLLAYKIIDSQLKIDMDLLGFFIKGPLHTNEPFLSKELTEDQIVDRKEAKQR
jgi:hypothetical protein